MQRVLCAVSHRVAARVCRLAQRRERRHTAAAASVPRVRHAARNERRAISARPGGTRRGGSVGARKRLPQRGLGVVSADVGARLVARLAALYAQRARGGARGNGRVQAKFSEFQSSQFAIRDWRLAIGDWGYLSLAFPETYNGEPRSPRPRLEDVGIPGGGARARRAPRDLALWCELRQSDKEKEGGRER